MSAIIDIQLYTVYIVLVPPIKKSKELYNISSKIQFVYLVDKILFYVFCLI